MPPDEPEVVDELNKAMREFILLYTEIKYFCHNTNFVSTKMIHQLCLFSYLTLQFILIVLIHYYSTAKHLVKLILTIYIYLQEILGNGGNVPLDEKLSVMLNILKAIVFLMQYTERNDAAIINISSEEERFILRNLTKFAIFLIKSLSLNEVLQLIKGSAAVIWKLLQQTRSDQGPNAAESSSSSGPGIS